MNKAIKNATGKPGKEVYGNYIDLINQRYKTLTSSSKNYDQNIKYIDDKGSANLLPKWNEDGNMIAYLSNQNHDYFG